MSFGKKILIWRTHTINKVLLTTKQVQIINKKNFVIAALDTNSNTFMIYMVIWEQEEMLMYSKKQAQIKAQNGAQVETLLFDKSPTEILMEYFYYSNVFLAKNAVKLLENIRINEYIIKLEEGK